MTRGHVRGAVGDELALASPGHAADSLDRRGRIVAASGEPGAERYRVVWPDGQESLVPAGIGRVAPRHERGAVSVLVAGRPGNETSARLVRRWRGLGLDALLVSASVARALARPEDVVVSRLDVLPTLDGVEPGLLELLWLERRGIRVLNRASTLLAVHDKLRTARALEAAALPHPRTAAVRAGERLPLEPPLVLKPRFGSWGRDVFRCRDHAELEQTLATVSDRSWFRRHGALVQELLPPHGHDLRLLVAGGALVGACERLAAPGEWRTNVSLGGTHRPVDPPAAAEALALAAAAAVGSDLVGVDLYPVGDDFAVLELNGAVEFDERYGCGGDIYLEIARALGLLTAESRERRSPA